MASQIFAFLSKDPVTILSLNFQLAANLPKGIIEGHAVDDVRVFVKRKQLLARISVPHLTGPIVGARDELVTILVERAVCKRQQVGAQNLEQREFLFLVFLLLLDKF